MEFAFEMMDPCSLVLEQDPCPSYGVNIGFNKPGDSPCVASVYQLLAL